MDIGSYLVTPENYELIRKNPWKTGRTLVIDKGMRYYDAHAEDVSLIANNLSIMGLLHTGDALNEVLRQIIVHYFEKLFVLVKQQEIYWIVKNQIDVGNSLEVFTEAREEKKGVFVGHSHFGATYLMTMVLMVNRYDITSVGRFPRDVHRMLKNQARDIAEQADLGRASFLNIDTPNTNIGVQMIRRLKAKENVSNVYDENNRFCKTVELLGRKLKGGTGMDLILRNFSDDNLIVVTPFLIRTSDDSFRYELDRHYLRDGNIINSFYRSLEKRIKKYPSQWHFIKELQRSLI